MKVSAPTAALAALVLLALQSFGSAESPQRTLSKDAQWRITEMLRDARDEVQKHYYDPNLHGLDWNARYDQFAAMIPKAHDLGEGFTIIAAFLDDLHDLHTYFVPPDWSIRFDYGFRYAIVGNDCYVTHVRPGTDAESKLHVGDQIVQWNGFNVNREDFRNLAYFYNILVPQNTVQLDLRSIDGRLRRITVNTVIKQGKQVTDLTSEEDVYELVRRSEDVDHTQRWQVVHPGDVMIWRLTHFKDDSDEVSRAIKVARQHKKLIIDLRENSGGSVNALKAVLGGLFDHDVKICDRVTRKITAPMIAKHSKDPFQGDLVVLINAGSASAAELFARVVQLEHRGKVIGDRSAGAVMEAQYFPEQRGVDTKTFYGFSVTEANLLMADGTSLEKVGVVPDEEIVPTPADMAAGRDTVLAHAAELVGMKLDPSEAAQVFKFEWAPI